MKEVLYRNVGFLGRNRFVEVFMSTFEHGLVDLRRLFKIKHKTFQFTQNELRLKRNLTYSRVFLVEFVRIGRSTNLILGHSWQDHLERIARFQMWFRLLIAYLQCGQTATTILFVVGLQELLIYARLFELILRDRVESVKCGHDHGCVGLIARETIDRTAS